MNREKLLAYKREWMRKKRMKTPEEKLLAKGKCPFCTMLLTSEYHQPELHLKTFGMVCPYWVKIQVTEIRIETIHEKDAPPEETVLDAMNG